MTRCGTLFVALGFLTYIIGPEVAALYGVAVLLIVTGAILVMIGREPWPACCAHCPVYSRRRTAAAEGRREATAIITAAREEQAAERRAAVDRSIPTLGERIAAVQVDAMYGAAVRDPADIVTVTGDPLESRLARARRRDHEHRVELFSHDGHRA